MFSKLFDRSKNTKPDERVVVAVPGEVFRWPKGARITAIDAVVLALPKALFGKDEKLDTLVDADDEMKIAVPPDSDNIYLYVQPGMSVTIKKSSESYVVAKDKTPRKLRVTLPKQNAVS